MMTWAQMVETSVTVPNYINSNDPTQPTYEYFDRQNFGTLDTVSIALVMNEFQIKLCEFTCYLW